MSEVNKVRVNGKAQNRTALGIVNAYLVINPNTTYDQLKSAFPNSINPDSGSKEMFLTEAEVKHEIASGNSWVAEGTGFFMADDEWLQLKDGTRFVVVRVWTKDSLERLEKVAAQNGIEIASFEKGKQFKKGGFELEYLNGWTPAPVEKVVTKEVVKTVEKKRMPWWVWLLLAVLVAVVIFLLLRPKPEPQVVEKVVEKVVTVVDTVYVQQLEEIEESFNAAQFAKDKAELNDDAKFVLHDLAKLMERNADLKIRIVGHTSEEGDPVHNQKLSEARAKSAVDFLISQGVDESRLQYEGKGSSEPLEPSNHEKNRRTEFEVL